MVSFHGLEWLVLESNELEMLKMGLGVQREPLAGGWVGGSSPPCINNGGRLVACLVGEWSVVDGLIDKYSNRRKRHTYVLGL